MPLETTGLPSLQEAPGPTNSIFLLPTLLSRLSDARICRIRSFPLRIKYFDRWERHCAQSCPHKLCRTRQGRCESTAAFYLRKMVKVFQIMGLRIMHAPCSQCCPQKLCRTAGLCTCARKRGKRAGFPTSNRHRTGANALFQPRSRCRARILRRMQKSFQINDFADWQRHSPQSYPQNVWGSVGRVFNFVAALFLRTTKFLRIIKDLAWLPDSCAQSYPHMVCRTVLAVLLATRYIAGVRSDPESPFLRSSFCSPFFKLQAGRSGLC